MNSNHIFTEILYGYKRSRRNVIFRIFVLLGIVGITLYVFTPLSGLGSARNLEQLFRGPAMGLVFPVAILVHSFQMCLLVQHTATAFLGGSQ